MHAICCCLFSLQLRNNVRQNGAEWKRFGQLLPKSERGRAEDCRHCHLVRAESPQLGCETIQSSIINVF